MPPLIATLCKAIIHARESRGWSRAALAILAGVSPHTVKAVEEGSADPVSLRLVLRALKVRLSYDPYALARLRREKGISKSALARSISVSRQTISAIESGRRGCMPVLVAVANALGARLTLVPDKRGVPTWYTPPHILDALYRVFGDFDLDPCSPDPPTVRCRRFFTEEDDGLKQAWGGTVFCNPPYETLPAWNSKMLAEFASGRVKKLIARVPARLETTTCREIVASGVAIFILDARLKFGGRRNPARFASAIAVWGASDYELGRLAAALPLHYSFVFGAQKRAAA